MAVGPDRTSPTLDAQQGPMGQRALPTGRPVRGPPGGTQRSGESAAPLLGSSIVVLNCSAVKACSFAFHSSCRAQRPQPVRATVLSAAAPHPFPLPRPPEKACGILGGLPLPRPGWGCHLTGGKKRGDRPGWAVSSPLASFAPLGFALEHAAEFALQFSKGERPNP